MLTSHYVFAERTAMRPINRNSVDQSDEDRFIRHFGMPSEQFRRELEEEFEQATPEEQAEFERLVDEANAVLHDMLATVDRMSESLAETSIAVCEMTRCLSSLDARVSRIEDNLTSPTAIKSFPSREGEGGQ